jgi:hypothetical protein
VIKRPASSLHRFMAVNTIEIHAEIAIKQGKTPTPYVKAKTTMFFGFAMEITNFFWKLPMEFIASLLPCFNIFFVKALRQ